MAQEVLNALFSAQETISEALDSADRATEEFDNSIGELNLSLAMAERMTEGAEEDFDRLANSAKNVGASADLMQNGLELAQSALNEMAASGEVTEQNLDDLVEGLSAATASSRSLDSSAESLGNSLQVLAANTDISESELDNLRNAVGSISSVSQLTEISIDELSQALAKANLASSRASRAVNKFNDSLYENIAAASSSSGPLVSNSQAMKRVEDAAEEASDKVRTLSGDLSVLGAISQSSALAMGSLSVNIGPFNLALRNIIVQLPAILTGMSTMLALVTALATAFLTLGAAAGTLLAGGALMMFEEVSADAEDAAAAMEALMGALRDLFTEAMEPVMNEANMDLFIAAIEGAAGVVNRFAQFVSQMRGEVMGFFDSIDGDVGGVFEAMHDSFVLVEPILEGFVEFFLNEFPKIIVAFAKLTNQIGGDIQMIIISIGALISELMDLATSVIDVLAPALAVIFGIMTLVFAAFNVAPDLIQKIVIAFIGLSVIAAFVALKLANVAAAAYAAHTSLLSNAASGSLLGTVYSTLVAETLAFVAAEQSLFGVLAATVGALRTSVAQLLAQAGAKLISAGASGTLTAALGKQLAVTAGLIRGNMALSTWISTTASVMLTAAKRSLLLAISFVQWLVPAIGAAVSAVVSFGAALVGSLIVRAIAALAALGLLSVGFIQTGTSAGAASTGVWSLSAAINSALAPVYLYIGAIVLLIGALAALADFLFNIGIFDFLITQIQRVLGWIGDLIGGLGKLIPGFGGGLGGDLSQVADPSMTEDIQSNSDLNLNFEDRLEQNMEVNADPEEKEQMRRIVKDAMNEANSIARRQQGGGR
jgi:hypothetical protein